MHLEKHLLRLLRSALLAVSAFSLCHDQAVAKEHEIIVQGSKATIDGLPLTLTIPCKTGFATIISYKSAVQALGPVERSGYGHNDLALVWDSLGFHLLRDGNHSEDGQLWNFAGSLRKDKKDCRAPASPSLACLLPLR